MRRNTIVIKAPRAFIDDVLWPEFEQINAALVEYLSQITERVIREEVYGNVADADEVAGSS